MLDMRLCGVEVYKNDGLIVDNILEIKSEIQKSFLMGTFSQNQEGRRPKNFISIDFEKFQT